MLLIACCVAVSQANLLTNPGFEDGPTGQLGESFTIPGWNYWGTAGWHHDDAGKVIDTLAVKLWWGDTGYWQDVDVAAPGTGEILIRHTAVGLNFIDVYHRTGLYPVPSLPAILGSEAAGVVEAVGEGVSEVASVAKVFSSRK